MQIHLLQKMGWVSCVWTCLIGMVACGPATPDTVPDESTITHTEQSIRSAPKDSTEALAYFWEDFQRALSAGAPEMVLPYVAFPLHWFEVEIDQAQFTTNYRQIIWPEADSLIQFIRPTDLELTNLSPYRISTIDHHAGYSTLVGAERKGESAAVVYFFGVVNGEYKLVGYATAIP